MLAGNLDRAEHDDTAVGFRQGDAAGFQNLAIRSHVQPRHSSPAVATRAATAGS
jgi:hypothetical protein